MEYFPKSYCYLQLFTAYNLFSNENFLEFIKNKFGRYPLLRRVVGYLYSFSENDFFVPMLRLVGPRVYHIDQNASRVRFSEMIHVGLFSEAKVGGRIEAEKEFLRKFEKTKL